MPVHSTLDRLRAQRETIAKNRHSTFDLPIPGYGGTLVARYRPLELKQVRQLAAQQEASEDEDAALHGAASFLSRACDSILMRVDGELVPLEDTAEELGDGQIKYDQRLATAVGVEDQIDPDHPARSTVIAVIGNDLALMEHQADAFRLMRGVDAEVDADF